MEIFLTSLLSGNLKGIVLGVVGVGVAGLGVLAAHFIERKFGVALIFTGWILVVAGFLVHVRRMLELRRRK
jgi:hypothetical protein